MFARPRADDPPAIHCTAARPWPVLHAHQADMELDASELVGRAPSPRRGCSSSAAPLAPTFALVRLLSGSQTRVGRGSRSWVTSKRALGRTSATSSLRTSPFGSGSSTPTTRSRRSGPGASRTRPRQGPEGWWHRQDRSVPRHRAHYEAHDRPDAGARSEACGTACAASGLAG